MKMIYQKAMKQGINLPLELDGGIVGVDRNDRWIMKRL